MPTISMTNSEPSGSPDIAVATAMKRAVIESSDIADNHRTFRVDQITIRHMWQSDEDINSVQGPGAFTTIVASTAGYGIFLDAYPWDSGSHGNGFSTESGCNKVLRELEARSELCNSPADWKFYRRWRSSEKAKM